MNERNADILRRYVALEPVQAIADDYGISHQRAWKIIRTAIAAGSISRRPTQNGRGPLCDDFRRRLQERARAGLLQREAERNSSIEALLSAGRTYGQIAEKLGCTRNTVAGVAHRARRRRAAA